MRPSTVTILRSKGLAVAVHVAFWALLALIISHMGGKAPEYHEVTSLSLPALTPVPVTRLEPLFAPSDWPGKVLDTNRPNPFYTTAFLPTPKPAPAPPPPPPTTRKVTLVYQGFYQTTGGPQMVTLKTAEGFTSAPVGAQILTNHFIATATFDTLALTNTSGKTNLLMLNKATELEIPIK